ncbi:phosphotransferase [Streptomyces sp. NPDC001914]|uniref:phosphotransferase n=1 Tax=Streptomyces sp. NPDC001914 TaxID=3364623 RepID=UPI003680B034
MRPPEERLDRRHGGGPVEGEAICHGDLGPWNVAWQGHWPVRIIDWEFARPAP